VLATIKCHGWELVLDGLYCSSVFRFFRFFGSQFFVASKALVE
jgi:hypothetical protein